MADDTKAAADKAKAEAAAAEKAAADKAKAEELPDGHVRIRVLPLGDGKVATGTHDRNTSAPLHHARGDILVVSADVGEALEVRGFGEIQP